MIVEMNQKRRLLVVGESTVFHTLVMRAVLRVYKNQTRDLDPKKAKDEAEALKIIHGLFSPDVVISAHGLKDPVFQKISVIYTHEPFNAEHIVTELTYLLAQKNRKERGAVSA